MQFDHIVKPLLTETTHKLSIYSREVNKHKRN